MPGFCSTPGSSRGRAESAELNQNLPFDARRIDGVVLSHAHIDQSGGCRSWSIADFTVRSTPRRRRATFAPSCWRIRRISRKRTSSFLQAGQEPGERATLHDGGRARSAGPDDRRALPPGPPPPEKHGFEFTEAGHILGSASVDLRVTEGGDHRLVFSGDIGRSGLPIIRDPEPPTGPIDTLIIEATYADREHESVSAIRRENWARSCVASPGAAARC